MEGFNESKLKRLLQDTRERGFEKAKRVGLYRK